MAINFDLNDLQAFRAVVEQGSFRKAADTVRLSQPALSRRIKSLKTPSASNSSSAPRARSA